MDDARPEVIHSFITEMREFFDWNDSLLSERYVRAALESVQSLFDSGFLAAFDEWLERHDVAGLELAHARAVAFAAFTARPQNAALWTEFRRVKDTIEEARGGGHGSSGGGQLGTLLRLVAGETAADTP